MFYILFFFISDMAFSFNENRLFYSHKNQENQFSSGTNKSNSFVRSEKSVLKMQHVWSIDLLPHKKIKNSLMHNSSPVVTEALVIQANGVNGVQAFSKSTGHLVWSFPISGGVFSTLERHKGQLYFGASDGFFYSLDLKTGKLIWKFFTGSENLSPALIHQNKVYWTDHRQQLYALSLKGTLLWTYAGPSLTREMIVRGRPRPAIYKNNIYMGFYDGSLVALNKHKGTLKWKKSLSTKQSIYGHLIVRNRCLLVSVFKESLFCLNPLNGQIKWQTKGDQLIFPKGHMFYKIFKQSIVAVKKSNRKIQWSVKLNSYPIRPTIYKQYLIYGSLGDSFIYVAHKTSGQLVSQFKFGRGLASPVTVNQNHLYFLSIDAHLHKVKL